MIKKFSERRIIKATLFLFIIFLFYLFPNSNDNNNVNFVSAISNYHDIYLLDKNNYVSKTTISVSSIEKEKLAYDLLTSLIIDSENKNKIPNSFKQVIPKKTKINSVKINNSLLSVSFSNDIKKIGKNKDRMIECIVYTLTSINNIKNIELLIEEKNDSFFNKNYYSRSIGINKKYEVSSLDDLKEVTIYYVSKLNDSSYYIPVTKTINSKDDKIKIIIDELSSKSTYESDLISYLRNDVILTNYNIDKDEVNLYFNESILSNNDDNKILEEVKYSISYSINDTIEVSNIHFFIGDKEF